MAKRNRTLDSIGQMTRKALAAGKDRLFLKNQILVMEYIDKIIAADCVEFMQRIPDNSIDCCVTSPPYYGLRNYGADGQIGLEERPEDYVARLVAVFEEVRRILKPAGTLWLNLGDTYAGSGCGATGNQTAGWIRNSKNTNTHRGYANRPIKSGGLKHKDLIGIPWAVAFALRSAGWYLRQDIIWNKPNAMPESVTDRCTKSHEYIFLLSKSQHYHFDWSAIREPATGYDGRRDIEMKSSRKYAGTQIMPNGHRQQLAANRHIRWHFEDGVPLRRKRSVWVIPTKAHKEAHFAMFPEALIIDCIKAGCPEDGIVLDPFMGGGTTAVVARQYGRHFTGCDINIDYVDIANRKLSETLL